MPTLLTTVKDMKFILIINQQSIIDNNLDLDFEDAAILQFINDFTACDESVKRWKDNRVWAWVRWQLIIRQLPMLRRRDANGDWQPWKTDTVYSRIKALVSRGFLLFEYEDDKQWVALTSMGRKAIGVVNEAYPARALNQASPAQVDQVGDPIRIRAASDPNPSSLRSESDHISNIEYKRIDDKGDRERAHVRGKEVAPEPQTPQPPSNPPPSQYPDFVQVDRPNKTVTILGITFANDEARAVKEKIDLGLAALASNEEWYWWWEAYGVQVSQQATEIEWFKWNTHADRERIIWHTAVFAHVTPLTFRPEPWKYLKYARFNDSNIIDRRDKPKVSSMMPENSLPKGNLGGKTNINPVV
jgi:hypothetical protein